MDTHERVAVCSELCSSAAWAPSRAGTMAWAPLNGWLSRLPRPQDRTRSLNLTATLRSAGQSCNAARTRTSSMHVAWRRRTVLHFLQGLRVQEGYTW